MKYYAIFLIVFLIPIANSFAQTPDVPVQNPIVAGSPSSNVIQGTQYKISSVIDGGQVLSITADPDAASLIFDIATTRNGEITMTLPRDLIDSKIGSEDDIFFVLVEGEEVSFSETKTPTHRYVTVPFVHGAEQIEIIGTSVVPEFPLAIIVLSLSIMLIILMPKLTRNFKLQI